MSDLLNKITWLGHSSFKLTGDKIIYIDPFQIKEEEKADIILITHEHFDHYSPEDVEKIKKENTIIVTTPVTAEKIKGNVKTVIPGDELEISGIKIEAVPSYNTNKKFHPKNDKKVGFIITINGESLYHAGDTDLIPEMEHIKADIALLPVSGTYVMTSEEACKAAELIKPKYVIPMHYGSIVGSKDDALKLKQLYKGETVIFEKNN